MSPLSDWKYAGVPTNGQSKAQSYRSEQWTSQMETENRAIRAEHTDADDEADAYAEARQGKPKQRSGSDSGIDR